MTTSRKNTLSKIMKAAWTIYREGTQTWSEALKAAWIWGKKKFIEDVTKLGEIIKETAKAVYAVVGASLYFDYKTDEQKVLLKKMWIPKSLIINDSVPNWFIRKNSINY